jgi:hypothetical protein
MTIELPQHHRVSVGGTEVCYVDFTSILYSSESLTGTPTVTGSSDLTLASSDCVVTSASYVDDEGVTVASGKAVMFSIAGGTAADSPYSLTVTAATNSTPARVLPYKALFSFE